MLNKGFSLDFAIQSHEKIRFLLSCPFWEFQPNLTSPPRSCFCLAELTSQILRAVMMDGLVIAMCKMTLSP